MKKLFALTILGLVFVGCKNDPEPEPTVTEPTCNFDPLLVYTTTDDICNSNSGSVVLTPDVVVTQYSIDGVTFQTGNEFAGLSAGIHTITMKDANDCTSIDSISIASNSGKLAFTSVSVDGGCNTSVGSITVTATGSTTYTYSMDGGPHGVSNVFSSLTAGFYNIEVKDENGCSDSKDILVKAGDISYMTDVSPILMSTCATTDCHESSNSSRHDLTNFADVKSVVSDMKTRINSGNMPASGSISTADKRTLICWIDDGAPNN